MKKKSKTRPLLRVVGLTAASLSVGCVVINKIKDHIPSTISNDEQVLVQGTFILHKAAPTDWVVRITVLNNHPEYPLLLVDKTYLSQKYPQKFSITKDDILQQHKMTPLGETLSIVVYYSPPSETDSPSLATLQVPIGMQRLQIELKESPKPPIFELPGNPKGSFYSDPTKNLTPK